MFGTPHVKQEGAPVHPDDTDADMSDGAYVRQLQAYKDHFRLSFSSPEIVNCVRQDLVRELR